MKVEKWLEPENLEKVKRMASNEKLSIAQIAKKMKISARTFYRWLEDYEEFKEAFEEGRETVDGKVETSFIKMCIGYKETVIKPQKIKRTEFDERGRKIEYEEFIDVKEEVYIKPDVGAQKFYLTNRKPEDWRNDTKDLAFDGDENTGVVMLQEVIEPEEGVPVIEAKIVENAECGMRSAE